LSKVLVTDSSERAALAVIRSLGKRGIKVVAADSVRLNAGFLSKYCSGRMIYPSPLRSKGEFVKSMLHFVRSEKFDLLIPVTDITMTPILEHMDRFEKYVKVAAPPPEVAIKALDKIETLKIAEKNEIPFPRTFLIEDVNNLKKIAKTLQYPVVIKPRMKIYWSNDKGIVLKVTPRNFVYSERDLIQRVSEITSHFRKFGVPSSFFFLQEAVSGEAYGVEVLMYHLKPRVVFAHKRLREYPITGGASTLRMSVKNEMLMKYAFKLLKAMSWQGVAMVEFKLNKKNGEAKLIEVNGRFWGSLSLAINSGVDFPYLLYEYLVRDEEPLCHNYKLGIMQRWLIPGDLLWLYSSLKDSYDRSRRIIEFISAFGIPDDIVSFSDFAPTFGAIIDIIRSFYYVIKGNRTMYGETNNL